MPLGELRDHSPKGIQTVSYHNQTQNTFLAPHPSSIPSQEILPADSASNIDSGISSSSTVRELGDEVAARVRNIEAQITLMSREISRYMVPPEYAS